MSPARTVTQEPGSSSPHYGSPRTAYTRESRQLTVLYSLSDGPARVVLFRLSAMLPAVGPHPPSSLLCSCRSVLLGLRQSRPHPGPYIESLHELQEGTGGTSYLPPPRDVYRLPSLDPQSFAKLYIRVTSRRVWHCHDCGLVAGGAICTHSRHLGTFVQFHCGEDQYPVDPK